MADEFYQATKGKPTAFFYVEDWNEGMASEE
jgi:hypothetical protein